MKTMKRTLVTLVCMLMTTASCMAGNEIEITVKELPQAAQTLISTSFKSMKVSIVTKEREGLGYEYEVRFADGTKVDFDRHGEWKDIDCRRSEIPAEFVPKQIRAHVQKKYPGQKIVQIDRDRYGYDIELSNGTEIDFNKHFKVTNVEH